MNRLTKPEYATLLALAASMRSTDPFTKIGAAVFDKEGYTLGTGYNGLSPGMETPAWMNFQENRDKKSLLFHHAETNILSRLGGQKPFSIGLTHNPCSACAKLIVASGIKEVYYLQEYERGGQDWITVLDFYSVRHTKISLPVEISWLDKTISNN